MATIVKKSKILVVDDETIIARDIATHLELLGYEVSALARTGEDAIRLAESLRPDLVLMDIKLAGAIDGITAAQEIRQRWSLPVVFLSAFAADEVLERAQMAEPFGYILKPFSDRDLSTVIKMALYKHQAEARLTESAENNQTILNNMAESVVTINESGIMESCNQATCLLFGYTQEQMVGQNVSMLMPEPHHSHHNSYLAHYQQTGEARVVGIPRELEGRRRDGSVFALTLSVSRVQRPGHSLFIGVMRDISQKRADEMEIRRLAYHDSLTELPNRRRVIDHLHQALVTSVRTGVHGALLLLDLDHFKQINDTLGHNIGDELLLQVAHRLKSCVREGDMVARLGGDEFVILLENLSTLEREAATDAELVAKKVLDAISQPCVLEGQYYTGTTSIGIVIFATPSDNSGDLIKKADVAMYQAKAAGRNCARFFDPQLQLIANAWIELKHDMANGMLQGQFLLYYQIQVDQRGQVQGVEALIRWQHPQRGMLLPAQFIPVAEESGLILPLGQWVLESACRQIVTWASEPEQAHWTIAVNVSAAQFAQPGFVQSVMQVLEQTGANPARLKLELTESMLVSDLSAILAKITALKACGVSFSLDDFGTGYSSLAYLKTLPFDQVKIDQSFVRDLLRSGGDAMIVRTILALGHNLGMRVIAEGVETIEQRNFLIDMGCDEFQGYYYGRPVAPESLRLAPT